MSMSEQEFKHLTMLLRRQSNVKISVGVAMGIILLLYFFTFAMLVDKASAGFFIFEAITAVIIFISFFKLNRISFALIKIMSDRRAKALLNQIKYSDVDKNLEQLRKELIGNH